MVLQDLWVERYAPGQEVRVSDDGRRGPVGGGGQVGIRGDQEAQRGACQDDPRQARTDAAGRAGVVRKGDQAGGHQPAEDGAGAGAGAGAGDRGGWALGGAGDSDAFFPEQRGGGAAHRSSSVPPLDDGPIGTSPRHVASSIRIL